MPRASRRQQRQPAPISDVIPNDQRPRVRYNHLGEGCIVWLPVKDEDEEGTVACVKEDCCSHGLLDAEGFNHPVVIVRINGHGTCTFVKVRVLEVTKMSTKANILQVTSVAPKTRRNGTVDRLTISNSPPADQNSITSGVLYLEKGKMTRQSFVCIKHIYEVKVKRLRTCKFQRGNEAFNSSETRLTSQSYDYLIKALDVQGLGDWIPTPLLIRGEGGYKPALQQASTVNNPDTPAIMDNDASARDYFRTNRPAAWHAAEEIVRQTFPERLQPASPRVTANAQTPLLGHTRNVSYWGSNSAAGRRLSLQEQEERRANQRRAWLERQTWLIAQRERDLEANRRERHSPPGAGSGAILAILGCLLLSGIVYGVVFELQNGLGVTVKAFSVANL